MSKLLLKRLLKTLTKNKLVVPTKRQYTDRMKIEKLIQHLQNLNKNDKEIVITDPNGYQYKIESLNFDEDSDIVYLGIDEGSCE